MTTIRLINTSPLHIVTTFCVCVMSTLNIYSQQISCMLTVVPMLYTRSTELIDLVIESTPFPPPPTP